MESPSKTGRWTTRRSPISTSILTQPIRGIKWNDRDADGIQDADEPGVAGWTVYLDANHNGALTLEGDGSFSYTPEAGFVGVDQFQYTLVAGGMRSLPATVTLRVEESTCGFHAYLNADGVVDLADLALLVGEFGSVESSPADVDCDGRVGLLDLMKLQNELSQGASAPAAAVIAVARRTAAVDEVHSTSAIYRRTRMAERDESTIAGSRRRVDVTSSEALIADRRPTRREGRRAQLTVVETAIGSYRLDSLS